MFLEIFCREQMKHFFIICTDYEFDKYMTKLQKRGELVVYTTESLNGKELTKVHARNDHIINDNFPMVLEVY